MHKVRKELSQQIPVCLGCPGRLDVLEVSWASRYLHCVIQALTPSQAFYFAGCLPGRRSLHCHQAVHWGSVGHGLDTVDGRDQGEARRIGRGQVRPPFRARRLFFGAHANAAVNFPGTLLPATPSTIYS